MGRWIDSDQQTEDYREACRWYASIKREQTGPAAEKILCLDSLWEGHQGVSVFFLEGEESGWLSVGLLSLLRKHDVGQLADLIEQASKELYGTEIPPKSERDRLKPFDGPDEALIQMQIGLMTAGQPIKPLSGLSSRGRLTAKIDTQFPLPFEYCMSAFVRLVRDLREVADI